MRALARLVRELVTPARLRRLEASEWWPLTEEADR